MTISYLQRSTDFPLWLNIRIQRFCFDCIFSFSFGKLEDSKMSFKCLIFRFGHFFGFHTASCIGSENNNGSTMPFSSLQLVGLSFSSSFPIYVIWRAEFSSILLYIFVPLRVHAKFFEHCNWLLHTNYLLRDKNESFFREKYTSWILGFTTAWMMSKLVCNHQVSNDHRHINFSALPSGISCYH